MDALVHVDVLVRTIAKVVVLDLVVELVLIVAKTLVQGAVREVVLACVVVHVLMAAKIHQKGYGKIMR